MDSFQQHATDLVGVGLGRRNNNRMEQPIPESLMSLKVTFVSNKHLCFVKSICLATIVHWMTLFAKLYDRWTHLLQDNVGLQ